MLYWCALYFLIARWKFSFSSLIIPSCVVFLVIEVHLTFSSLSFLIVLVSLIVFHSCHSICSFSSCSSVVLHFILHIWHFSYIHDGLSIEKTTLFRMFAMLALSITLVFARAFAFIWILLHVLHMQVSLSLCEGALIQMSFSLQRVVKLMFAFVSATNFL